MKNAYKPITIAIITLLLCFLALPSAQATPEQASVMQTFTFADSAALTAAANYASVTWGDGNHEEADIFWVIDQTAVNTLSLALQVSPDNSTWYNHSTTPNLVTNNVADSTAYSSTNVEGAYYKLAVTLGNTETVTLTLKVVLR